MKTIRLTMAQALVRFLMAQRTTLNGSDAPLFAGLFGIFGHGNVTCLSEALEQVKNDFPTWRGQNEQSMALAGIAYAKAMNRRQIMVSLSSIGPGSLVLLPSLEPYPRTLDLVYMKYVILTSRGVKYREL